MQCCVYVVRTPWTWLTAFAATGVAGVLLNALGTGSTRPLDVLGVLILLTLTAVALVLAKLVPAVPSSIWVLALATIASATFLPSAPSSPPPRSTSTSLLQACP